MSRLRIAHILLVTLSASTVGCGATNNRSHALSSTRAASDAPIDDGELLQQLEQGALLLHEGGRTVPMPTLISQLGRSSIQSKLAPPPPKRLSAAQLYRRARRSVVVIGNLYNCGKCEKWHVGQASGFIISEDGLVVTSHHVVDRKNNATLVAMTGEGRVIAVKEVVAASKADDIAILRVDATALPALPIARATTPGDNVWVVSHPDGFFYTLTSGIVSRTFYGNRTKQRVPVLQVTANFAKGSSGAPVLNDHGAVVGVVSYTRSIHKNHGEGEKRNLQMVLNNCAPASQVLALLPRK